MQENHGLYVNRTEPIHLMTEVTSVLGSDINRLHVTYNQTVNIRGGQYSN